jgi:nucleoside-diphosphate-sugar epimerase
MAILVTGGTGFVGLNLVEALLARGDSVVVLSNGPLPHIAEPAFARLPGRLTLVSGDVRDARLVGDAVRRHAIERIVHGAAITADHHREARSPGLILEVNLLGLVHILEAARDAGVLRVLLIGSAAAYGRRLWQEQHLDEQASGDPDTLYAISKAASEQILWRLGNLYRMSVVVGRLATVFGPFEWPGGWRDTLSPILQVTEIARTGRHAVLPRDDRRDWLYSRDAAAALLQLLDAAAPRERLYNLGSGCVWSLADWCVRLARRYPGFVWSIGQGAGTPIELHAPGPPAALSEQRFAAEFGPVARHNLQRAFEDYLAWLENPIEGNSAGGPPGRA